MNFFTKAISMISTHSHNDLPDFILIHRAQNHFTQTIETNKNWVCGFLVCAGTDCSSGDFAGPTSDTAARITCVNARQSYSESTPWKKCAYVRIHTHTNYLESASLHNSAAAKSASKWRRTSSPTTTTTTTTWCWYDMICALRWRARARQYRYGARCFPLRHCCAIVCDADWRNSGEEGEMIAWASSRRVYTWLCAYVCATNPTKN